jgi:hypothetical protein
MASPLTPPPSARAGIRAACRADEVQQFALPSRRPVAVKPSLAEDVRG